MASYQQGGTTGKFVLRNDAAGIEEQMPTMILRATHQFTLTVRLTDQGRRMM
jgi:hypothetical protein